MRTCASNIEAPVYAEDTPRWVLNGTSRREIPRAAYQLASLLRRWRADILHTHHYDQAVIGWLATRIYPQDASGDRQALLGFHLPIDHGFETESPARSGADGEPGGSADHCPLDLYS